MEWTFVTLSQHVGEEFVIDRDDDGGAPAHDAILTSAVPTDLGGSLTFAVQDAAAVGQGTHRFVHPTLGSSPIFVVPVSGSELHAVFA